MEGVPGDEMQVDEEAKIAGMDVEEYKKESIKNRLEMDIGPQVGTEEELSRAMNYESKSSSPMDGDEGDGGKESEPKWLDEQINLEIRRNIYHIFKMFYSVGPEHESTPIIDLKINFALTILLLLGFNFFIKLIEFLIGQLNPDQSSTEDLFLSDQSHDLEGLIRPPEDSDDGEDQKLRTELRELLIQEKRALWENLKGEGDLKTMKHHTSSGRSELMTEYTDMEKNLMEFKEDLEKSNQPGQQAISDNLVSFMNNGVAFLKEYRSKYRRSVNTTIFASNYRANLDTSDRTGPPPFRKAMEELKVRSAVPEIKRIFGTGDILAGNIFELFLIYNSLAPKFKLSFTTSLKPTSSAAELRKSNVMELEKERRDIQKQLKELKVKDGPEYTELLGSLAKTERKLKELKKVTMTYRDILPPYFEIPTSLYDYIMKYGFGKDRYNVEKQLKEYKESHESELEMELDGIEGDDVLEEDGVLLGPYTSEGFGPHFKDSPKLKFFRKIVKDLTKKEYRQWAVEWNQWMQKKAKVIGRKPKPKTMSNKKGPKIGKGSGFRKKKKKKKPIQTKKQKKPSKRETKAQRSRRLRKQRESRKRKQKKNEKKSKKKNRTNRKKNDRTIRIGDSVEIHYN